MWRLKETIIYPKQLHGTIGEKDGEDVEDEMFQGQKQKSHGYDNKSNVLDM